MSTEEKIVRFEHRSWQDGFTVIPNCVLMNGRLSLGARMMWGHLAYYARQSNQAWPGQVRLAASMGVGERTIRTYLRELESIGLLETRNRGSISNLYTLLTPSDAYMDDYHRQKPPVGPVVPTEAKLIGSDVPVASGSDAPNVSGSQLPTKNTQGEEDTGEEEGGGRAAAAPGASPQSLPGLEPPVAPEQRASGAQGPRESALQAVWSHYVAVFGHKLRIKDLTDPRSRTISKALSAAGAPPDADDAAIYAAMDLCIRAIDGLASYRSAHPSGSQDTSISVIFETGPHSRSSLTDQIEWWADQAADQAAIPPSIPKVHRERVMELAVAVLKLERESVSDSVRERGAQAEQILAERFKVKVHGDGTGKLRKFEVIS